MVHGIWAFLCFISFLHLGEGIWSQLYQNLISSRYLDSNQFLRVWEQKIYPFLSYFGSRQADRQIDRSKIIITPPFQVGDNNAILMMTTKQPLLFQYILMGTIYAYQLMAFYLRRKRINLLLHLIFLHVFTYIPMGVVLTSGDLHVGHHDLSQLMLGDPTQANNNTPKTGHLCPNSNLPNSDYKWLMWLWEWC